MDTSLFGSHAPTWKTHASIRALYGIYKIMQNQMLSRLTFTSFSISMGVVLQ